MASVLCTPSTVLRTGRVCVSLGIALFSAVRCGSESAFFDYPTVTCITREPNLKNSLGCANSREPFQEWHTQRPRSVARTTPTEMALDWAAFAAKLPAARDPNSAQKRDEVFQKFDLDGNGVVSTAEFDQAVLLLVGA